MARIEFRNLGHSYRPDPQTLSDYALQPMNRVWRDGGAYALLGPSGCGKSTLLNIISGLLTPSEGQVLFDGQDVTHASPRERNIAQVFQFPVIYDTMTVFDNLAFPLRNRKVPEAEVRQRVEEVAEILELQHALKRRASGLAADAKQKISLGRGLVRKDVAAILFDEPLTVIDPHLKWQLRRQLKKIHQQLKLTLIYVTHDQVEALTFADEVVVMTEGKVVQQGGPEALFERPDHTFVGYFIGSPGMNLYPVTLDDNVIALGGQRLGVGRDTLAALKAASGPLKLGIRPEFVQLAAPGEIGTLAATVHQVQQLGTHQLLTASLGESGDLPIRAKLPNDVAVDASRVWLRVDAPQTLYYCNDERIGR